MPENPYPPHDYLGLQRQVDRHDTQLIDHERRIVLAEVGMADVKAEVRNVASDVAEIKADTKALARASDVAEIKDQLRWISRMVAGALVTGVIGVALAIAADRIF